MQHRLILSTIVLIESANLLTQKIGETKLNKYT